MNNDRQTFEGIRKAVEKRDRFLEEHPELKPFQDEIARRLRGAGSIENRMAILQFMIEEKILELQRACLKARDSWEGNY